MKLLRDVWRGSAVYRFFEDLKPIDRAIVLVAIALALATGLYGQKIFSRVFAVGAEPPRLTAPPFEMQFADRAVRQC